MPKENEAIVRRFYEEVFNRGNLDAASDYLATDAVDHDNLTPQKTGLEDFVESISSFRDAFPDLRVALDEVISVDDKVVVRWTDRGTHRGDFLGMAPTGREVTTTGISVFRLANGKIVEQWTNWDTMRLLGQLGVGDGPPRDLVGRMLSSQEQERRRVAYEVHDGLAQTAVAAHSLLEAYAENHPPASAKGQNELERVLELVQRVVEEARRVIGRLRPTALDDLGLAVAVRSQVETLRKEGWEVVYTETLGDDRLPPDAETAVFRVAQEALTNARKHAGTSRVRIELDRAGDEVCLRVQDFGRGFEADSSPLEGVKGERVGLYSMRERVALLGGEFYVSSKPGKGTLVVARVPVQANRRRS